MKKVSVGTKKNIVIVCKGLFRALCGTILTVGIATAVFGLCCIDGTTGYASVGLFMASVTALVTCGYLCWRFGSGRHARK